MHPDDIEEWRPAVCAPEYYEVSNLGRVRRAMYSAPISGRRTWPGRMLKTDRGPIARYDFVYLICGSTKIRSYVHTLVAEAFLGPRPSPKHTSVNHIDGDSKNNVISNLEWATPLEQIHHSIRIGTADPFGVRKYHRHSENHWRARLTAEIVQVIRHAPPRFSIDDLAELFGVDRTHISGIRLRKTWRHLED